MLKEQAFPANLAALPQMLSAIQSELSLFVKDTKQQRRLILCAEEILVNIIEYAYPDNEGNLFITVEYAPHSHQLQFTFSDSGIPYNPLTAKKAQPLTSSLEEQPIGGLGIFLYTTIMDGADYRYQAGMNHLNVWKNL